MGDAYRLHGTVAVITIDNPPVNGLSQEVRKSIVDGLEKALSDDAVRAIVITGAGNFFSAGADIREFTTPKAGAPPHLHSVIYAIEESPKPVIADGQLFVGLALDETNQYDLSDERIQSWCEQILNEMAEHYA